MARATIIVQKWVDSERWQHKAGYPSKHEKAALIEARSLEKMGTRVRVYRRTPDGPKVIYESPKSQLGSEEGDYNECSS